MKNLLPLLNIDPAERESLESFKSNGSTVKCETCTSLIMMPVSSVVGHSHRHGAGTLPAKAKRKKQRRKSAPTLPATTKAVNVKVSADRVGSYAPAEEGEITEPNGHTDAAPSNCTPASKTSAAQEGSVQEPRGTGTEIEPPKDFTFALATGEEIAKFVDPHPFREGIMQPLIKNKKFQNLHTIKGFGCRHCLQRRNPVDVPTELKVFNVNGLVSHLTEK
jgi:hypothetical protein